MPRHTGYFQSRLTNLGMTKMHRLNIVGDFSELIDYQNQISIMRSTTDLIKTLIKLFNMRRNSVIHYLKLKHLNVKNVRFQHFRPSYTLNILNIAIISSLCDILRNSSENWNSSQERIFWL